MATREMSACHGPVRPVYVGMGAGYHALGALGARLTVDVRIHLICVVCILLCCRVLWSMFAPVHVLISPSP